MKIASIRSGFANNSSSSHSVVLHSELDEFDSHGPFGWNDFFLKTPEAKNTYFASQVFINLSRIVGDEIARHAVVGLFSTQIPIDDDGMSLIDHQSVWVFPSKFGSNHLCVDFIKEFHEYLMKPEIGIAGGNDNSRSPYDYGEEDPTLSCLPRDSLGNLTCRKDGDFWTLFNKKSGQKIRLSFVSKEPMTASTTPELVDFKITDFCPFGCEFCYQGSTKEGKHGDIKLIRNILYDLKKLEVFEVAIGGGEPTMHPDFAAILEYGKSLGICMNFTTFTTKWTKDRKIERAVLDYSTAFAVSVTEKNQEVIKNVAKWQKLSGYDGQVSIQVILELLSPEQITNIIKQMKKYELTHLTILGHKSCGRAEGHEKVNSELFLHAVNEVKKSYVTLSVDSVIVERYSKELTSLNVSHLMTTDRDGQFSMYIDAVTKNISANSYGSVLIPVTSSKDWESGFQQAIEKHFPFINGS